MPSETDPLLPQGNSTPEITGYGFSKFSKAQPNDQSHDDDDSSGKNGSKKETNQRYRGASPLRTMILLFAIVVGIAFVITLTVRGPRAPTDKEPEDDSRTTTKARVDRILSETPLIGPRFSFARCKRSV